jgi:hypothetical protein
MKSLIKDKIHNSDDLYFLTLRQNFYHEGNSRKGYDFTPFL